MRGTRTVVAWGLSVAMLGAAGCSSDESSGSSTSTGTPTSAETTAETTDTASTAAETTAPVDTTPVTEAADSTDATAPPEAPDTTEIAPADERSLLLRGIVDVLASDELAGRDNNTQGSVDAQLFLIELLAQFADPISGDPSDDESYKQPFDVGTNLVAMIPGTDLADEYVVVGAHYDHLGSDCAGAGPDDDICNGATDNATGVAAAMTVARSIAEGPAPRRSVIVALWDAEEDGLLGSAAYLANPLVPLEQTVAYVNFDIQGTNISPALTGITVAVGAETGGTNLIAATQLATEASSLDTVMLSLLFGQGRSDHANFVGAAIPSVFFTDATPPCYHTASDDVSIVDFAKLEQQVVTAEALTRTLVETDDLPVFDPTAPPAAFADAEAILALIRTAQPDFGRFPAADKAIADQFVIDLGAIVAAGPGAFDDAAAGTLLSGTVQIVTLWSNGMCDGFLEPAP